MARIPLLKKSIPTLGKRFGTRQEAERQRSAERDTGTEYRAWYRSERWMRLRDEVLLEARFICCKTGTSLIGKPPAANSPVVDHIKPHRGDPDLFWDKANLQAVCKSWHDSIKQAQEKADQIAAIHPKWLQPSQVPLTIVCGPPCSGKSTWVTERAGRRDLIIDLDVIASDISGEPLHGWNRDRWLNAALWRRNNMLGDLGRGGNWPAAWFIVSEPKPQHRDFWVKTLRPTSIVVLEVDEAECMRRAAIDDRDMMETEAAVTRWWVQYGRRIGDQRVT